MQSLQPPDSHYVNAAKGWLGLGSRPDALAELERISKPNQQHPDVLEVRWAIHAGEQDWESALKVARALIELAPDRPDGWLHHAYALRRVPKGGLEQAWAVLKPAAEIFPEEPVIPFNLSCYACQMNQLDEARTWLKRALKVGGKEHIKKMALADSDLEALWNEIRKY